MKLQKEAPMIVGLVAPSAAGKSWLATKLIAGGVVDGVPTITTRPPRPNEIDTDYDHIFVGDNAFEQYVAMGAFSIVRELYGYCYGLRHKDLERSEKRKDASRPKLVLMKASVVEDFVAMYGSRSIVYGVESLNGKECAEDLMCSRGQSEEDIANRMATYDEELVLARRLILPGRYFISKKHPREIIDHLASAIRAENVA